MSKNIASLIVDSLDIWSGAVELKPGAGRGAGKRLNLYGLEKLRALVLDLAVRGKLVAQDDGDEDSATLMKRSVEQLEQLVDRGEIGRPRKVTKASSEPPFEIPKSWQWVQIGQIGHDWGQCEPQREFTYIDVGSIDQDLGLIRDPKVLGASSAPSRARKIVRPGTVIYSTVRPYLLNIAIIDRPFDPDPIASTAFAIIHPFDGIEASFIYRYLRSPIFIKYVESCQTGIAYPAINDKQFFSAWFPLPPTGEQQRIVAKIDEIFGLCDSLEAEIVGAAESQKLLADAIVERAIA